MELKIQHVDGSVIESRLTPADLVRFERHFSIDFSKVAASPKVEHLMFMAWTAQRRTGLTELDFETWLDTVAEFGDEAVPLPPPSV